MSKRRHRPSASPPRTPQEVAAEFIRTRIGKLTPTGDPFQLRGRCPAHDDHRASLSVSVTEEAKVLLHCHAGCSFREIVEAAGLDLYKGVPIVEVYDYRDAKGKLICQVCRTADKQFPGRLPDGRWVYPKGGLLYRLPELLKELGVNHE